MDTSRRSRNRITLPTFGAELFTYLKDVNDNESFTASMRLKDVLTEHLKIEIVSWFSLPSLPELDKTLLRKITNSLLAAGIIGHKRTRDALSEIRLDPQIMKIEMNLSQATENLREWSRDFRSAKGFIDHQYKCVNSFLRIQKTTNDETVRTLLRMEISNYGDFKNWQKVLEEYWNKKGATKENLRSSYENNFHVFMNSFDDNLQCLDYRNFLDQNWRKYLDSSLLVSNNIEQIENFREKIIEPNSEDLLSFEIDLRIENGAILYSVVCNRLNEFQASELRFKLALAIAKKEDFKGLGFSVSLVQSEVPIILIRADAKSDEKELSQMVALLEETIERSKLPG